MADYNLILQARERGYSDDEIADILAKSEGFDSNEIRARGYSSDEILGKLGYVAPAPVVEESSALRRAGDYGITALKGAIGVPEAAVGLADIATGGYAGKLAEKAGFRPKEAKAMLDEYLSPEQQAANKAVSDAKGFIPTIGAAIENPSTIAHTVTESIPLMLGGGVIAQGIKKVVPKIAGYAAGAIGEGAVGAGMAAEQVRQQTDDGRLGLKQTGAVLASGAGTALFGAMGGKLAQKFNIGDIDTMLANGATRELAVGEVKKGMARRIIEGGVAEGVFEEMPQSMQEQVWQNVALGRPAMDGVSEAGAMGLLTGGVMGGGINLVAGGKTPAITPADILDPNKTLDESLAAFNSSLPTGTDATLAQPAGSPTPPPVGQTAPPIQQEALNVGTIPAPIVPGLDIGSQAGSGNIPAGRSAGIPVAGAGQNQPVADAGGAAVAKDSLTPEIKATPSDWRKTALKIIDHDVFKDIVSQSVQKDGQKVLDAISSGDIATLKAINIKYAIDAGRNQGGGGAGPGKVKRARAGGESVYNASLFGIQGLTREASETTPTTPAVTPPTVERRTVAQTPQSETRTGIDRRAMDRSANEYASNIAAERNARKMQAARAEVAKNPEKRNSGLEADSKASLPLEQDEGGVAPAQAAVAPDIKAPIVPRETIAPQPATPIPAATGEAANQGAIQQLSNGDYVATGFTRDQLIKAGIDERSIDPKGQGRFPAKTNKIQLERALGISKLPEGTILAEGDRPFSKRKQANQVRATTKGLSKTHEVVEIEGGYGIVPKVKAQGETPPITPSVALPDSEYAKMSLDEFDKATRTKAVEAAPSQPESWYKAQAQRNYDNIQKREQDTQETQIAAMSEAHAKSQAKNRERMALMAAEIGTAEEGLTQTEQEALDALMSEARTLIGQDLYDRILDSHKDEGEKERYESVSEMLSEAIDRVRSQSESTRKTEQTATGVTKEGDKTGSTEAGAGASQEAKVTPATSNIHPNRIPKDLSVSIEVGEKGSGEYESILARANVIAYTKRINRLQEFRDCR